ncbi:hypothetical protein K501DRAFT_289383 [Backusella circina FSU 941]|nr:hypothetical protein K501DRAFT_289383 [Backusella circina FSU 941]
MAKAGYDPRAAIDVWQKMSDLDQVIGETESQGSKKMWLKNSLPPSSQGNSQQDVEYGVREFLESLVNSWFGSTHPPNLERLEYMKEHMDEAVVLYNETIRLNGLPKEHIFSDEVTFNNDATYSISGYIGRLGRWIVSFYY